MGGRLGIPQRLGQNRDASSRLILLNQCGWQSRPVSALDNPRQPSLGTFVFNSA
jgi:hypothetical protein